MTRILAIISLISIVGSCTATKSGGYMDETYTSKGAQPVRVMAQPAFGAEAEWLIYDLPAEGKIMVSPTYTGAIGMGMAGSAIHDPESAIPPEPFYEKLAMRHITDSGRTSCRIIRGYKTSRAQYEFLYDCTKRSR